MVRPVGVGLGVLLTTTVVGVGVGVLLTTTVVVFVFFLGNLLLRPLVAVGTLVGVASGVVALLSMHTPPPS